MSNQLYFAADTLGVPLYCAGNTIFGGGVRTVKIGPFEIEEEIFAFSDVVGQKECAFFAAMGGNLWLYLVQRGEDSIIYLVDASKLELTESTVYTFGGVSVINTLLKLNKAEAVKAAYTFDRDGLKWDKLTPSELQEELPC